MSFLLFKKRNNGEIEPIRPWGNFEILGKIGDNVVKKITVRPGKKLSYQSHSKRAEHWFIVRGEAKVILDDVSYNLSASQSIDIPVLAKHRLENTSPTAELVIIEISTGEFDERDIIRYEDDFGRV